MKKILLVIGCFLLLQAGFTQQIKKISINELEGYIAKSNKPLVVNFWATFCKPCIEEIPYFQSIIKKYGDAAELLLVSLDLPEYYPARIASFASNKKFTTPIVWLNETNADLFCPKIDTTWSGGIPATLFINNKKNYKRFFERQLTEAQVKQEMKALVK
jgi:thiol-disulfide isomerase/thioredoxin